MPGKKKIFIFGGSGHAKVVIDLIEREGRYTVAFLVDDDPALEGMKINGYRVIGGRQALSAHTREVREGIVAIGCNTARSEVARWMADNNLRLVTAIHPSVQVAGNVSIGQGSVLIAGAIVNTDTSIGDNVIVNTKASVGHDCVIGDAVHIAPGTVLCGGVKVGDNTFIGAGTTVIPNINIGKGCIVGAGSVIIRDVPEGEKVVGNPGRIIGYDSG